MIPYTVTQAQARALTYPLFVKPVKATFSVLAKRCESPEELIAHLTFKPWEKHIIKRLVKPFNDACRAHTDFTIDAHWLIGESILRGEQISKQTHTRGHAFVFTDQDGDVR